MSLILKRPSTLATAYLAALSALLLSTWILWPAARSELQHAQDDYGQSLATLTAKRLVDAAFNQDLVRLQGVLQELTSHPKVVQATIHDVENTLLVQAGEARPAPETHQPYTASIVLHDSLSGYVTITLEKFQAPLTANLNLLSIFALTLLGLLAWNLYRDGSVRWQMQPKAPPPELEQESVNTEIEEDAEAPTPVLTPEKCVYALIHIKNYEVLKQQLNSETFRTTMAKFEQITHNVLSLYNGEDTLIEGKVSRLRFNANDATNEALFRASCSAWLIVELASIIDKIPLDLAAFVSADEQDLNPSSLPVAGLILEQQAAENALIKQRLNFMETGIEEGRYIVAEFKQPFSQLLENQRKYLSQQFQQARAS